MRQKALKLTTGLLLLGIFIMSGLVMQGCILFIKATEITYAQLKTMMSTTEDVPVLIDVRPAADFNAGHIQDAINIPLDTFCSTTGVLVNNGEALTSVVADKGTKIIAYCAGYGNDVIFANAAVKLNYTKVYYYKGGTADWSDNGDYYVIEYSAFKSWHDAENPFDDGDNYLIDDLPVAWYTGDDPAHPGGHIPGAINIPVELWADADGNPIADGAAFTAIVADKEAKVIIYCGNPTCGKSLMGAKAAVKMGYKNVFRFQGGQSVWKDNGNDLTPGLLP